MNTRITTLQYIADLAPLTNAAQTAARAYALKTKTKGTQLRFRRMRASAEASYHRFRSEDR